VGGRIPRLSFKRTSNKETKLKKILTNNEEKIVRET
jgi:hypothetical protein